MDSNTGEIWAAQLRTGVYRLIVSAKDGSGYEAAQVARVRIAVLAADASKPYAVFVKSQYSFTVPEDAPIGTAVGTVTVSPDQSGTILCYKKNYCIAKITGERKINRCYSNRSVFINTAETE